MPPQITTVLQVDIPSIQNNPSQATNEMSQQTATKRTLQKKKHINYLLQQIKQYEKKINAIKAKRNNKQGQVIKQVEKQGQMNNNEQVSIVNQKQLRVQQQQKSNNILVQKTIKEVQPNEQQKDHFQYQIQMLKQQNNLLKEQNQLLKQQQTLKLKINKTDQFIINHHTNFINATNKIQQPNQYVIVPPQIAEKNAPILINDSETQNISLSNDHDKDEVGHKNFVRSAIRPISTGSNQLIRPQSFRKRDAGKILFVKSKYSSQKPHEETQGHLSPPNLNDNHQHEQVLFPVGKLKREVQSESEIKFKEQNSKNMFSSQIKTDSAQIFIKQRSAKNKQQSKQKLIKQEAFDKINVIKHTLSEKKFSKPKQKQQFTPAKSSKLKNQFEIKLQSNSQRKKSLRNEKLNQIQGQPQMGKNLEVLEFNTEKEKIDFESIGSSVFADKKNSIGKKAQINFHNVNISQLNSFKDFLKLVPQTPLLPNLPKFQNSQQELLQLAKQTFPLFNVHSLQSPDTDLNIKKFKNCVYFGIDSHHNILWHYDGKLYFGSWRQNQQGQGQKSGQGMEFYPKKYVFSGQFSHGKRNGQGILNLQNTSNQSIYIGQFVNGKKQGRGKIIDQNGNNYEGEWYDDKRHGFGLYRYENEDSYQGTFVKGVKQGFGCEKFNNGDVYRGEYKNDKFQGKGQYIWRNSSQYEGEFRQGKRNGKGIWKSSNLIEAQIYQGEYLNDKKDGYGIYRWHNGSYYQGYFKEDKKHGVGKTRYQNGKIAVLEWVQGQSVRKIDKNEWPDFAIDQNQSTINVRQEPKQMKPKFNTFFSYKEVPTYHQTNLIIPKKIYFQEGEMSLTSRSKDVTYQSYESQGPQFHQKTFTGLELRQAKYQPIGSNLDVFNL